MWWGWCGVEVDWRETPHALHVCGAPSPVEGRRSASATTSAGWQAEREPVVHRGHARNAFCDIASLLDHAAIGHRTRQRHCAAARPYEHIRHVEALRSTKRAPDVAAELAIGRTRRCGGRGCRGGGRLGVARLGIGAGCGCHAHRKTERLQEIEYFHVFTTLEKLMSLRCMLETLRFVELVWTLGSACLIEEFGSRRFRRV